MTRRERLHQSILHLNWLWVEAAENGGYDLDTLSDAIEELLDAADASGIIVKGRKD